MWGSKAPVTLALLLVLLFSPLAGAQLPTEPQTSNYGVSMTPDRGSAHIDYLGSANLNLTLEDVSTAQAQGTSGQPVPNQIFFDTEIRGDPARGWQVSLGTNSLNTRPGETHRVPVIIEAGATIEDPVVEAVITATYEARDGSTSSTNTSILAVAKPNPVIQMRLEGATPTFAPDEQKRIPVVVQNGDYYPQMVAFRVDAPEGWTVSPPSSIQMGPKEQQTVYFDVKAPQDPWFRMNPTGELFLVDAEVTTANGNTATVGVPTPVSGWFLPGWVIPHLVLLGLGVIVFGKRATQKAREHRLEKCKPTFPGIPLEKEARYRAMQATDPDEAETMRERLKDLWGRRKEAWKDWYREQKDQAREQRRELREHRAAVLEARRSEEQEAAETLEQREKRRQELLERKRRLEEQADRDRQEAEEELAEELRKRRKDDEPFWKFWT